MCSFGDYTSSAASLTDEGSEALAAALVLFSACQSKR